MKDALQAIIAKSPDAMSQAIDTLRAIGAKSPVVQQRYQHTVSSAFADPKANFTADERALIASYLDVVEETGNRDKLVQIRVTAEEKSYLERAAREAGFTAVSTWARNLWGLETRQL
jgi:hypothetical protein